MLLFSQKSLVLWLRITESFDCIWIAKYDLEIDSNTVWECFLNLLVWSNDKMWILDRKRWNLNKKFGLEMWSMIRIYGEIQIDFWLYLDFIHTDS